jgi:hypothetical protein
MAAWREPRHEGRLALGAWLALAVYLAACTGVVALVVWKIAHPLSHLIP